MARLALFSLDIPSHALGPARLLAEAGFSIVCSRETFDTLHAQGLPCIDVAEFTGCSDVFPFPPTLHPKIEAALTTESFPEPIEIVFDEPYSLENGNDIGGHALLALALKGGRLAVAELSDMLEVAEAVRTKGSVDATLAERLRRAAAARVAAHFGAVLSVCEGRTAFLSLPSARELANGENPYQKPAFLCRELPAPRSYPGLPDLDQLAGDTPCFTNLADLDSLLGILMRAAKGFDKLTGCVPFVVAAAKHGNVCGMSADVRSPATVIRQALWGNPVGIWGGEVALNFTVTKDLAQLLLECAERRARFGLGRWSLDVIAAPCFTPDAVGILGTRKRTKLFVHSSLAHPETLPLAEGMRRVTGGFLLQPPADYVLDFGEITGPFSGLGESARNDAVLSWAAAYGCFLGGNEVGLARHGQLLAVGGGPSTVEAAKIAVWRARENGHSTRGAIFAADAFLPFADAAEVLIAAGCRGGIAPAGGRHYRDVVAAFERAGVPFSAIPEAYRGFCRH